MNSEHSALDTFHEDKSKFHLQIVPDEEALKMTNEEYSKNIFCWNHQMKPCVMCLMLIEGYASAGHYEKHGALLITDQKVDHIWVLSEGWVDTNLLIKFRSKHFRFEDIDYDDCLFPEELRAYSRSQWALIQ